MPAPMAPCTSASEALTIWMFSTAMKAPRVEPITAIQVRKGTWSAMAACLSCGGPRRQASAADRQEQLDGVGEALGAGAQRAQLGLALGVEHLHHRGVADAIAEPGQRQGRTAGGQRAGLAVELIGVIA